ncbi:hypothetical protein JRQ81_008087 [Phrynocephalus forsythii]|uniref:RNA 2-O ribose methyltransferase substrate binding domain-containing protein n=1 Tax=Phrynocephalus forsythii TaxID=171643 RepID=A0A9Q0XC49_9SAUR|nr:hypothetical protein JRQ81_008087 [Phrynocephalus forsythii]
MAALGRPLPLPLLLRRPLPWIPLWWVPCRRRGPRGLRRSPVRLLPSLAQQREEERRRRRPKGLSGAPKKKKEEEEEEGGGKEGKEAPPTRRERPPELRYERACAGDKRLSKLVTIAKSRAFREKHGKILLEGKRLIADALDAGAIPQTLFFSMMDQLKKLPADKLKRAKLIMVKYESLKAWSDVVTPQGLIGIFSKPDHSKMIYPEVEKHHQLPLSLICENIRDPGNLGTILRSAAGAGCSRVLLVKGCVDAWDPKVLRGGMGAHFHIPIISDLEWRAVPNYLLPDTRVYVADSSLPTPEAEEKPLTSPEKASSHGWVSGPYNMKARLSESDLGDVSEEEEEEEEEEGSDLEVQHYYEPWMDCDVAMVIGGETYGVSGKARELADRSGGRQLLIPTVPHVNSLNSAMAASILLFEAKRQLRMMENPLLRINPVPQLQLPRSQKTPFKRNKEARFTTLKDQERGGCSLCWFSA